MLLFCRKEWVEKSSRLGDRFKINEHMGLLSVDALRRAKDLYEVLFAGKLTVQTGTYFPPPLARFGFVLLFERLEEWAPRGRLRVTNGRALRRRKAKAWAVYSCSAFVF